MPPNNTVRILLSALLLACLSPGKTDASDDLFDMPLEDLLSLKITSSTLTDKNLRTAPSTVSVFTHQQIQSLGIDYLHELMNYVPGFQSFRQEESGDEYYHSVRGHRSSTSSREVLILIDGQRFNREFDNAIGAPMLAPGNIEKVEFIRGPGSAIYGSNAFLGVINITTIKNKNEVAVNYGSNNNTQAQVLSSSKLDELAIDVYANAYQDDGESYKLEDSVTHNSYSSRDPRDGYDFNLKLGLNTAQLNLIHFERQSNKFYVLGSNSNNFNETRNHYSSIQFQNSFNWQKRIETDFSLRYNEASYFAQGTTIPPVSNFEQKEQTVAFDIHNNWTINTKDSVQFGLEQRHIENDKAVLDAAFGSVLVVDTVNRDVSGLYLQNQHKFTNDTEFTLGAHYDHYSQIGSALSPRLGLTHQLSDVQTIKLLYGEAFRAPTTNELMLENNGTLVGNPNLDPETIKTWELVWMGNWQQHSLAITLFNNVISDAIVRDDTVAPATFVNASGDETSQGAEIEYIVELFSDWQLRSSYSWFDSLANEDFRQADQLASLMLNYQQQQWNFNIAATYAAARGMLTGTAQNSLDDYWLVNSKLQYAINDQQSIYLQAKNLLDESYETPFQIATFVEGIPNRGREIEVGARWEFE